MPGLLSDKFTTYRSVVQHNSLYIFHASFFWPLSYSSIINFPIDDDFWRNTKITMHLGTTPERRQKHHRAYFHIQYLIVYVNSRPISMIGIAVSW